MMKAVFNCRRNNILCEGISNFLLWIFLYFVRFCLVNLNQIISFSDLSCKLQLLRPPASRTLFANYRPRGKQALSGFIDLSSEFLSLSTVSAVYSVARLCVDIYKSLCQRNMLALFVFFCNGTGNFSFS